MNSSFFTRKNTLVDQSLQIQMYSKQKRESLLWGSVNCVILAILMGDLSLRCKPAYSFWCSAEYLAAILVFLSAIYYLLRFTYYCCVVRPLSGTEDQRRLLSFVTKDTSFTVASPKREPQTASSPSSPINVSSLSWQSFGAVSSDPNWNATYRGDTLDSPHQTSSPQQSFRHGDESITDEKSLKEYIRAVSEMEEKNASIVKHNESSIHNSPLSFWNTRLDDVATLLKTSLYQLSPTSTPSKSKDDLMTMIGDLDASGTPELQKVSSVSLAAYITNLRMWIANTILHRVVKEINNIDESLRARGFSDIQLGSCGLERLKKTSENRQLVMHVPTLPMLVPFLDMSTNQEYLVQRIKDLAKGNCLADYRWNSGSDYNGVKWDEHLPTDSSIVFHVFCSYLDSQLMPLPDRSRPFTSRYVVTCDTKKSQPEILNELKNRLKCGILCTNSLKPKFNFISDGKIHNCAHDRNNLLQVIIQFLLYMKTHNEGSLEGVNLGKRGINILCCIEDSY